MVRKPKSMIQKLIDTKISLVTIVGWFFAIIGLTFTISTAYGEQKQKLLYLSDRQTKIELSLDRTESMVRSLSETVIRIETELKSRQGQTKK